MALSSTLYAGLSGLNVNQTKLNVVGNNIANVNTVAFKSTRAEFKPQFYVTNSGGTSPDGDFGGTNPNQVGLGATVGGLERNLTQGSIETTGRPSDVAISGEGFFIARSANGLSYTRDGSFNLNPNSKLVTTSGEIVQGYPVDQSFNVVPGTLADLTIPLGVTTALATRNAHFSGNLNGTGPVSTGASILGTQSLNDGSGAFSGSSLLVSTYDNADPTFTPIFNDGDVISYRPTKGGVSTLASGDPPLTLTVTSSTTIDDLSNFFSQGLGINTGIPDDLNDATPQAGVSLVPVDAADPSLGSRLTIIGNLGKSNEITIPVGSFTVSTGNVPRQPLTFTAAADANGVTSTAVGESTTTELTVYDSLGTPVQLDVTIALESTATTGNTWRFYVDSPDDTQGGRSVATGTLVFDTAGRLRTVTGADISLDRTGTGTNTPLNLTLDFSNVTALSSAGSNIGSPDQDGAPIGTLIGYSIGEDGKINGSFSNGVKRTLGQIALATFSNPQGLVDQGGNMFIAGADSGNPVITAPTELGAGTLKAGSLELSNVDLSEEFINLIIASTGFSAASRVISTSNQLITELLNTSR